MWRNLLILLTFWLLPGSALAEAIPVKFDFMPGMFPDDPPGDAEACWRNGSGVTWKSTAGKRPLWETEPGFERASVDTFNGKARRALQYSTNAGYGLAAVGTHTSLWELFDSELYFSTPVASRGRLTNPFTTTNTDATVNVNHTAHGRLTGGFVRFPGQTTINGATISATHYAVTKVDADNFTVEADTVATSSGAGVGGSVDYEYYLAAGREYGLAGEGYGTGAYDTGTYGGSTTGSFAARLWSLASRGQDLIASIRDGGIYFLAPYVVTSDLAERVTNGSFTTTSGWSRTTTSLTLNGSAAAFTTSGGVLKQQISLLPGGYALLTYEVATYTAGTIQPYIGGLTAGPAVSATGVNKLEVWTGAGGGMSLEFQAVTFSGSLDNASVKMMGTAVLITNAPTRVTGSFVTDKGHVMAYGAPDDDGNFDAMLAKCSDPDDVTVWTDTVTNEARSFPIYGGSRIITGLKGANSNFLLTDTSLHVGTYVPSPTVIYRWQEVGTKCGCIGQNAAVVVGGRLFWMGNDRNFWVYEGGEPKKITCPGTREIFDNLAPSQGDLIQAHANGEHVWWSYADKRDGTEVSRNARYNYIGGWWEFDDAPPVRTAFAESQTNITYPIRCGTNGLVYFHEKGYSGDGVNLTFRLRSGAIDIADGATLMEIQGYSPDIDDQRGSFSLNVYGYERNDRSTPETASANLLTNTDFVDFFVQGRQCEIEYEGDAETLFVKAGPGRFWIMDTGNLV